MLPNYYGSFGRNQVKSELITLIEANRAQDPVAGVATAELEDGEKARILLHVSSTVNSVLELNPLLEAILDQLIQAVSVEQAFVYLRDESIEGLRFAKGRNNKKQSQTGEEVVIRAILEEVYRDGSPFVSADAQRDVRVMVRQACLPSTPGKILCAPLKVSKRVLACSMLITQHQQNA
jgi:transcriptional regulator with GAF, ATPase, and Fis domain